MSKSKTLGRSVALTVLAAVIVTWLVFGKRLWIHDNVHAPLQRRAVAFTEEMKARGRNVGIPMAEVGVNGVKEIITVDVEGRPVRFLVFDRSVESAAAELKRIHEEHVTHILGKDQPAEDEGDIVIIDFEDHPNREEIIESFHKEIESK